MRANHNHRNRIIRKFVSQMKAILASSYALHMALEHV